MTIQQRLVFAISPGGTGDGVPLLLVGIPQGAFDYMRDGKTNTLDLTKLGVPLKLVVYGAESHAAAKKIIDDHNAAQGVPCLDLRRDNFSIKEWPR